MGSRLGTAYTHLIGDMDDAAKLRDTAAFLLKIAQEIEGRNRGAPGFPSNGVERTDRVDLSREALLACARKIHAGRRKREGLLPPELLGEPAWDILLELYIGHETGRVLSVTAACRCCGVPMATALRWSKILEKRGLVQRKPDILDNRVRHLSLTRMGLDLMRNVLSSTIGAISRTAMRDADTDSQCSFG